MSLFAGGIEFIISPTVSHPGLFLHCTSLELKPNISPVQIADTDLRCQFLF